MLRNKRMLLLKILVVTTAASLFVLSTPAQATREFNFGFSFAGLKASTVSASSTYSKESGYGFEPGAQVECSAAAQSCASDKPFYFSVALPEGNYRVTVLIGDKERSSSTAIKTELRRLMFEPIDVAKGKVVMRSFIVNIRTPEISNGGEVKLKDREKTTEWRAWDDKLTLEFNGKRPSISSLTIEKVNVPTVFLLGDSTVCDQPLEPYASWGQMLTRFFNDKVAVANNAESGESLRSSYGAKRLEKVLSVMKPGDYLLIQYGHNDEKEKGEGIGAFTSYKASLKQYVEAARAKGGIPILITPMHRRTFDKAGKITNSHGDYPEAVRQAAKDEKVPLIDLNTMSEDLYEALGPDGSGVLFKEGDGTHHNNYGAYELARCIMQAIKDQKLSLIKYIINTSSFDPKHPDPLAAVAVPASPANTEVKPLGN
jgi:lysophospholipase L1-like esterase